MSWFKRKKDWAAKEILTAGDLDNEFDNVAEALNSLIGSGRIASSGAKAITGGIVVSEVDVPGASASITLTRPSIVIVSTVFDMEMSSGTGAGKVYVAGALNVNGANQSTAAELGLHAESYVQANVGETYRLALGTGAHTLKLKLAVNEEGPAASITCWHATATYLIVPEP
jgi:hypothetical protein